MKYAARIFLALISTLLLQSAFAQAAAPRQEPAALRQSVENFLRGQTAELNGKVGITLGKIDSRLNIAACPALEPFLPTGARAWGKTTVGVRCLAPTPWTIYIQATVSVIADYVATATSMPHGQAIAAQHLKTMTGDLTVLPATVVTDMSQVLGRTLATSIPSGAPLRADALRTQVAVQQGQAVRLISSGQGFRISADARAMSNANEGQMVQAKTSTGQQISGIAKMGGQIEVSY